MSLSALTRESAQMISYRAYSAAESVVPGLLLALEVIELSIHAG
jgi:hypothetical protein